MSGKATLTLSSAAYCSEFGATLGTVYTQLSRINILPISFTRARRIRMGLRLCELEFARTNPRKKNLPNYHAYYGSKLTGGKNSPHD